MGKDKNFKIHKTKLAKFNDMLSVVVILVGVYIMITPFIPNFTLWWRQFRDNDQLINSVERSIQNGDSLSGDDVTIPTEDRIVIPDLQLNEPIYDGANPTNVDLGVWRRPHTSTPDKGSNTVMVGHRFFYSGSFGVFYHLDKLKPGDRLVVFWHQQRYDYEVTGSKIVQPTAIEVEAPTTDDILTLYTCTPIWTSAERLVVTAKKLEPIQ